MMKKIFIGLLTIFLLIISFFIYGIYIKPKSPKGESSIKHNNLELKVSYYRPYKKNRLIFGYKKDSALVPFNEYWRLGANFATVLSSNKSISFAGKNLNSGSYRMYAIPNPESWEVFINSEAGAFRFYPPDKKNDVLSVNIPIKEMDESLEQFTIDFNKDSIGINLRMRWDKTKILIPVNLN